MSLTWLVNTTESASGCTITGQTDFSNIPITIGVPVSETELIDCGCCSPCVTNANPVTVALGINTTPCQTNVIATHDEFHGYLEVGNGIGNYGYKAKLYIGNELYFDSGWVTTDISEIVCNNTCAPNFNINNSSGNIETEILANGGFIHSDISNVIVVSSKNIQMDIDLACGFERDFEYEYCDMLESGCVDEDCTTPAGIYTLVCES